MSQLARRLLVAAWGIPLLFTLIFLGNWFFAAAVAVVAVVSQWEFYRMGKVSGTAVFFALICGAAMPITAHFRLMEQIMMYLLPFFLFNLLYLPAQKLENIQSNFGITLTGIIYPSLFLTYLVLIRDANYPGLYGGAKVILYLFSSIWICDTLAYCGGKLFGKHKLAPVVSPNKTWEGAVSGLLGAFIWGIIGGIVLNPTLTMWECLGGALIVGTIGQTGDLAESSFKRSAGVKDTSNIFGPHGGMLDRFDSIIASAPAFYLFLKLIGKI